MTTEVAAEPKANRLDDVAKIARKFPFTSVLTIAVVVVGVVSEGFWRAVEEKEWFVDVAYGVPAFDDGKYWTPLVGWIFGATPGLFIVTCLGLLVVTGWTEYRLGTAKAVVVIFAGQLVGQVSATLLILLMRETHWEWAHALAETRGVGPTTAIIAAVAATSATLHSPWRLRVRAGLAAYVCVLFLFVGSLTDLQHLLALVIFLPVGEKFLSTREHGVGPRTRRETRMLSFLGLIVIAVASVVIPLLPENGPLGPTEGDEASLPSVFVTFVVIAIVAGQLWKGRAWAWWLTVVYGFVTVAVTAGVIVTVIVTRDWAGFGGVSLGIALLWCIELQLLISGRWAFEVPFRARLGSGADDPRGEARGMLTEAGGSTMSWWTTWAGNSYHFGEEHSTMQAYQKHVGVVIGLCDPVGPKDKAEEAITDFTTMVEERGLMPCLFSVTKPTAEVAERAGWKSIQIAEDTIVDLPNLEFKGKSWQDVRTAINRAAKEGIEFRLVTLSEEPAPVLAQIRAISEEWVGDKGLPEMGFTLGSVEEALDPAVRVAMAVDKEGTVHGFLSWMPAFGPDGQAGWTLDLMRRKTEGGFRPVIEFLIGQSAMAFKAQGAKFVSLSGAPLARSDQGGDVAAMDKMLDTLGAALEPFYGFRSLHSFKKKFHPRYEPVYMCFRDEADLPRIGIALTRAYLPKASIGQFIKLATSKH